MKNRSRKVSEIINQPLSSLRNLGNIKRETLNQIEKCGVEINLYNRNGGRIGASRKNPIEELFKKNKLTREEYVAGQNYQYLFELSQISHHARPSYDGTTISAASSRMTENTPKQAQIDASRFIFAAKAAMKLAANYETVYRNGAFKIIDLKLPEILENIFEKEIAIKNVESLLHLDRRTIHDRIKKITQILVDI